MQMQWLKMQMQRLLKRMMSAITHSLEICALDQVLINALLEADAILMLVHAFLPRGTIVYLIQRREEHCLRGLGHKTQEMMERQEMVAVVADTLLKRRAVQEDASIRIRIIQNECGAALSRCR